MKRICIFLSLALAVAASASTVAGAQPGAWIARAGNSTTQAGPWTARASRATKVDLRRTRLGEILSTASGFTLYEFTRDRQNSDSCVKISGCSQTWPALQASGRPAAGAGVKASLLSTIRLPGGADQVTYAGHPLYLYSGDSGPGDTSYVGQSSFGGTWDAIDAGGRAVK